MGGARTRVRIAAIAAGVAAVVPGIVLLVRGEELFHHPEPIFWTIWVPALVFVLALLLALSRIAALCFAMVILAVAAVEVGFAFREPTGPRVRTARVAGRPLERKEPIASFGAIPGASLTLRRTVDGETEYEATYNIDALGRRTVPVPDGADPDEAALFFGGSWTFGTGLDDGETLPAAFSRRVPRYRAYNYGYERYGPSQALDLVRGRDLRAEVPEDVSLAFYVLTRPDLARVIGSMQIAPVYCRRCSNYVVDESGAVVRDGDLSTGNPLRTIVFALLQPSRVLNYLHVDLPTSYSDEDRRRAAAVVTAVRDGLAGTFLGVRFAVVVAPEAPYGPVEAASFASAGIRVLDYTGLFDPADPPMRASATDGHPSALANERMARRLVADLDLGSASTTAQAGEPSGPVAPAGAPGGGR